MRVRLRDDGFWLEPETDFEFHAMNEHILHNAGIADEVTLSITVPENDKHGLLKGRFKFGWRDGGMKTEKEQ